MGTGVRVGREADILIQPTAASSCFSENVEVWLEDAGNAQTAPLQMKP
jgi:hypothetical protein